MAHPWLSDPDQQIESWFRLLSEAVHPVKVAVLEAFFWIGEPLSKAELTRIFNDTQHSYLSLVSYHVDGLVNAGMLEKLMTRTNRSVIETYFFFPERRLVSSELARMAGEVKS